MLAGSGMKPGVHIMHVVHGRMDLRRYPFD
jgi:hypothetical protein